MATTMNGQARIDVADARLTTITAGGHTTRVKAGAAAAILQYAGQRFHAEVESLSTFYGWRSLAVNTASGGIGNSNHLSGTAVDCNGARHPRYRHGTFTAAQEAALRRILADVNRMAGEAIMRWGGDWGSQVDEMHLELVGTSGAWSRAADAIAAQPASNPAAGTGKVPVAPDATPTPTAPREWDEMASITEIQEAVRSVVATEVAAQLAELKQASAFIASGPLKPNGTDDYTAGVRHFYACEPATMTRRHLSSQSALARARERLPEITDRQSADWLRAFTLVK